MKNKSTERTKPTTKKVRFNLYALEAEKVFLAGDFNGCVLIIPEIFGMNKHITPCQEGFPSITFEPYA